MAKWTLQQYDRFQKSIDEKGSYQTSTGLTIMSDDNPNEFWEKIFELGFEKNVFCVTKQEDNTNAIISVQIGSFQDRLDLEKKAVGFLNSYFDFKLAIQTAEKITHNRV